MKEIRFWLFGDFLYVASKCPKVIPTLANQSKGGGGALSCIFTTDRSTWGDAVLSKWLPKWWLLTSVSLVIWFTWSLVWRERWGRRGGRRGVSEGPEDDMVFLHVPTEAVECDVIVFFNNVLCRDSWYTCTNTCVLHVDAFATGIKNLDHHQSEMLGTDNWGLQ